MVGMMMQATSGSAGQVANELELSSGLWTGLWDSGNIGGRLIFGELYLETERSKMQNPFNRSLQPFYSLGIPKIVSHKRKRRIRSN